MRTTVLAIVAALATTSVSAADLGIAGLSLNTEVKAFHKVDAETNHITIEPELRWTPNAGPLSMYGEVPLTMYETNHASGDDFAVTNIWDEGHKPTLELGVDYTINSSTMAYAETTYDYNRDKGRGEIEIGVAFNF